MQRTAALQRQRRRCRPPTRIVGPSDWAQRLGLAIAPRLSLVDEENASLITGAERAFLEQQEEADTQGKGRFDERKAAKS